MVDVVGFAAEVEREIKALDEEISTASAQLAALKREREQLGRVRSALGPIVAGEAEPAVADEPIVRRFGRGDTPF